MELIAGEPDFVVQHVGCRFISFMDMCILISRLLLFFCSENQIVNLPLTSEKSTGTPDCIPNMRD